MAACQAQYIGMLMLEIKLREEDEMELLVDSRFSIDLAKHRVAYGRSKHIEKRFHFLIDQVNIEKLQIKHCKAEVQIADLLIKPLKTNNFEYLGNKLAMVENL
jgi:hypothetical protein